MNERPVGYLIKALKQVIDDPSATNSERLEAADLLIKATIRKTRRTNKQLKAAGYKPRPDRSRKGSIPDHDQALGDLMSRMDATKQ